MYWLTLVCLALFATSVAANGSLNQKQAKLARALGYTERTIQTMSPQKLVVPEQCTDKSDFFSRFRTWEEIEAMIHRICELRREAGRKGKDCRVVEIGKSVEKRPIYSIEIRDPDAVQALIEDGETERIALMVGTMHAREWTTTTTVLLNALQVDVENVTAAFIPVLNPDGYEFSWRGGGTRVKKQVKPGVFQTHIVLDRLWRKNRQINPDGSTGVDLNRNFGDSDEIWGRGNSSYLENMDSSVYHGPHGFSEPETIALKQYHEKYSKEMIAFVDIHCCIGAILEPFALKRRAPTYVFQVGSRMIRAINKLADPQSGVENRYRWRPRPKSSAGGSGISSNWAFNEAKIEFTYVVEIRGKFISPCYEIRPIAEEVLLGFQSLLADLANVKTLIKDFYVAKAQRESELWATDSGLSSTRFVKRSQVVHHAVSVLGTNSQSELLSTYFYLTCLSIFTLLLMFFRESLVGLLRKKPRNPVASTATNQVN